VAGVYVSTYTTSGPLVYSLRQYEPVSMTLQHTVQDRLFAVVADGRLWCLGTNATDLLLLELDRDDISNDLQSVIITNATANGLRLSSSNGHLYVSFNGKISGSADDQLERRSAIDGALIWRVFGSVCGSNPTQVVDDGTHVYVVNSDGSARTVTKLLLSDGSFVANVTLTSEPVDIVLIGGTLFVSRLNAFDAIDAATMTVTNSYTRTFLNIGRNQLTTNGVDLFINRPGINQAFVERFEVATATFAESVIVGANQAGLACTFDERLYTTGASIGGVQSVVKYDIGPITALTTASVSGYPFHVSALYRNPGAGWVVGSVGW
jgi:hypothetical protein